MSKIYVGDVGTIIDLNADPSGNTGLSLVGYTLKMEFKKPSGSVVEVNAALKPNSTTIVRYTIIFGDLSEPGLWSVQIKAINGSNMWLGETATFPVYAAFT